MRIKKATIKETPKDLNIIVYPSIDQLYETNIGGLEPTQFTIPTFAYKGARIVLAYNGSLADLKYELDEGLARSIWETQMNSSGKESESDDKKSSPKQKSSKVDYIPFWFKEGAIRFFAHGWDIVAEDKFRQSFEHNDFVTWAQITSYEPRLAGQAFCYFLSRKYYPLAAAQTVFQLEKKKSLSRAIRLTTKHSLDSLSVECFEYYAKRFPKKVEDKIVRPNITIPRKKGIISNVILSSRKNLVAYIALAKGKRTVYVYDLYDKNTKKITSHKLAPWIGDHSPDQYPLIQWHKDGNQLFVAKPKKGKLRIKKYSTNGECEETITLPGVDGLKSFQALSDRDFLLTAYRKGQSDVVSYNDDKEKYTAYTSDEYDDSKPTFTGDKNEVLFVSSRPKEFQERKTYLIGVGYKKDTLWQGIYTIKEKNMKPIAIDTIDYIQWDNPILLPEKQILATSTKYGAERYVVLNDLKGRVTPLGTFVPTQYLTETDEISLNKNTKDSIYMTLLPINEWISNNKAKPSDTTSPWLKDYREIQAYEAKQDSILNRGKDTAHNFLADAFGPKASKKQSKRKPKRKISGTDENKPKPYVPQLHSAYFSAQVNNDYLINRYQPYLNNQGQFKFPEIGGMTKGGITDLLENHHFMISFRLPAATDGSSFFMRYENTESKLDWGFSYYRNVETLKPDPKRNWVDENGEKYPDNAKVKTHYYDIFIKAPITYDCSIGLSTALRQDKTIFLATNKYTLDFESVSSSWSITSLTYKLNKLHTTIPYLYKGFKINSSLDVFKGFDKKQALLFGSGVNVSYHQPLYKYITLVTQLHMGFSEGDEKVLYNLGGLDNNVTPRVDTTVHFSQSAPYAFQTLITPLRGYYQNSFYGNEYALLNADLYFPLFQTLIPIHTPLPFINNLQFGMLSDLVMSRETWNDSNPNNSKWKASFGLSARTTLANYPLRLDLGWPGTFKRRPVLYFSLNLQ